MLARGGQPLVAKRTAASLLSSQCLTNTRIARRVPTCRCSHQQPGFGWAWARGRRRYAKCQVLAFQSDAALVQVDDNRMEGLARPPGLVRYRFVVPQYVTTFGQTLRVVGSLPQLGNWNPHNAPVMCWSDGHMWSLEYVLPQEPFEFKIVVLEGQGVRWEGGCNRVVMANDEGGDIPVEIVVWLTCNFDATSNTQMQLAVPRASVQDAYETGKATLEFLKLRRAKLGQDAEQASSPDTRQRQAVEISRLSEAVADQSTTVQQLGAWLAAEGAGGAPREAGSGAAAHGNGAGGGPGGHEEVDDAVLLLALDAVQLPRALRRVSFVQHTTAASAGNGAGLVALLAARSSIRPQDPATAETAAAAALQEVLEAEVAAPVSPFLRGELDSRAEELMGAAEELFAAERERQVQAQSTGNDNGHPPSAAAGQEDLAPPSSSPEWAGLAQEARQLAGALAALESGVADGSTTSNNPSGSGSTLQLLQIQGLASVAGSQVLAASGGEGRGVTVEPAAGGNGVGVGASEGQAEEQEGRSLERLYEAGPQAVVEAVGWAVGELSAAQEERAHSVSEVLHEAAEDETSHRGESRISNEEEARPLLQTEAVVGAAAQLNDESTSSGASSNGNSRHGIAPVAPAGMSSLSRLMMSPKESTRLDGSVTSELAAKQAAATDDRTAIQHEGRMAHFDVSADTAQLVGSGSTEESVVEEKQQKQEDSKWSEEMLKVFSILERLFL